MSFLAIVNFICTLFNICKSYNCSTINFPHTKRWQGTKMGKFLAHNRQTETERERGRERDADSFLFIFKYVFILATLWAVVEVCLHLHFVPTMCVG